MPVRSHSQIEQYLYVFLFSEGEKFECEIGSHSNLILLAENFRVAWSWVLAPGVTSVAFHCLVSTFDLSVFLKVLPNPSRSKKGENMLSTEKSWLAAVTSCFYHNSEDDWSLSAKCDSEHLRL